MNLRQPSNTDTVFYILEGTAAKFKDASEDCANSGGRLPGALNTPERLEAYKFAMQQLDSKHES